MFLKAAQQKKRLIDCGETNARKWSRLCEDSESKTHYRKPILLEASRAMIGILGRDQALPL